MLSIGSSIGLPQSQRPSQKPAAKYGSNPAVGKTFTHDGVNFYYEVYGSGEPLLLVHGNSGSIADWNAQIDYFRTRYQVIAMDSRDQGKSADSPGKLTYEKMADDLAALLDYLKSPPANVLGWSDGGIEALLLGIRHPAKIKKIASMAANLNPNGAYPEVIAMAKSMLKYFDAEFYSRSKRELKVAQLVLDEPHIDPGALNKHHGAHARSGQRSRSHHATSTRSTFITTSPTASSASSPMRRTWFPTMNPNCSMRPLLASSASRSSRKTG